MGPPPLGQNTFSSYLPYTLARSYAAGGQYSLCPEEPEYDREPAYSLVMF